MTKIVIIAGAMIVLAGAFPGEAMRVVSQVSIWLDTVTAAVTPGQQTALLIVAVFIGLFALSR
jgi:hypothetical protein